jgi:transcription termination/antitermination protein NusA
MASELAQAIQQVCDDKKIPVELVVQTIESALAAAYRKDFGNKMQNIKVNFDMETGEFKVFDIKEVVEDELKEEYEKIKEEKMRLAELEAKGELTDEMKKELEEKKAKEDAMIEEIQEGDEEIKKFNPKTMIGLTEASEIKKKSKLGDELVQDLPVDGDFGRMAAQTAKQVIIQKLREAERSTIFEEYKERIGELLTGTVQRVEGSVVLVDFGNVTAIMPLDEGIKAERYSPGTRFKFYVKSVEESARGPKVILSRTHPDILRKLFKLEVPEVASGSVQIKSIAREAGSRTKIAVMAKEDAIDPIGSCVGQRGTRVQTIINEIGGEKIDIIEWEEDPAKFIAKALAPAKIISVDVNEEEKKDKKKSKSVSTKGEGDDKKEDRKEDQSSAREAVVHVSPDQLSLAIGKEGQNVRLAAKLTGWKIDIHENKVEGDEEVVEESIEEEGKSEEDKDEVIKEVKKEKKEKVKKEEEVKEDKKEKVEKKDEEVIEEEVKKEAKKEEK